MDNKARSVPEDLEKRWAKIIAGVQGSAAAEAWFRYKHEGELEADGHVEAAPSSARRGGEPSASVLEGVAKAFASNEGSME
jgi:hypothetical protein